mmetsp:Transcript_2775/g.7767  ORF Transcript_2775/g.7767 Transcript_2775/m.7767 type:complete len:250 (-) Transcript_2775:434-1183(-)
MNILLLLTKEAALFPSYGPEHLFCVDGTPPAAEFFHLVLPMDLLRILGDFVFLDFLIRRHLFLLGFFFIFPKNHGINRHEEQRWQQHHAQQGHDDLSKEFPVGFLGDLLGFGKLLKRVNLLRQFFLFLQAHLVGVIFQHFFESFHLLLKVLGRVDGFHHGVGINVGNGLGFGTDLHRVGESLGTVGQGLAPERVGFGLDKERGQSVKVIQGVDPRTETTRVGNLLGNKVRKRIGRLFFTLESNGFFGCG